MAELVVVAFESPTEADRALMELARLQKDHPIDLEDAVVAIRQPDGKVNLKQSINLVGIGAGAAACPARSGVQWSACCSSISGRDGRRLPYWGRGGFREGSSITASRTISTA